MARRIEVVPYDPAWAEQARQFAPLVAGALGENCLAVHHIGSTSVPGLSAKPTLDFLVEVADIEQVDACNPQMEQLGLIPRGENGLPGRRYFVKLAPGGEQHSHHVHVYQRGHPDIDRHLAFRDYLIAHPDEARAYGELKSLLAERYPSDAAAYMDGKDALVKEMERKALAEQRSGG